jgi:tetratricopeptide (TPR) repeat protein
MLMRLNQILLLWGMTTGIAIVTFAQLPVSAITPPVAATQTSRDVIPADAQASFAQAEQLKKSDEVAAIARLDQVVQRYPQLAAGYLARGKLYVYLSDGGSQNIPPPVVDSYAIENLNRAIALDPNLAEAYVQRGLLRVRTYVDAKKAIQDFDRAAQLDPQGKFWTDRRHADRAQAKMRIGDWVGAKTDYNRAMRSGNSWEFDRGMVAVLSGQPTLAIRDFDTVVQQQANAPKDEIWPPRSTVFHWRGIAKAMVKDHNGAIADLNQAMQLLTDDRARQAELLRDRAWVQSQQGQLPAAIADLDQAIQRSPDDTVTRYLRAVIFTQMGDQAKAKAARQGLEQSPSMIVHEEQTYRVQAQAQWYAPLLQRSIGADAAVSQLAQASLLLALNDRPGAVKAYQAAVQLAPNQASVYEWGFNLGVLNLDPALAVANLTELIRLQPQTANWYRLRAFYATPYVDYQLAIADYDWLIRNQPTQDDYGSRGELKLELGDFRGAIADADAALRLTKSNPIAPPAAMPFPYLLRAEAYLGLRDYAAAQRDLATASKIAEMAGERDYIKLSTGRLAMLSGKVKLALGDAKGALVDLTKANQAAMHNLYLTHNPIGLAKLKLGDRAGAAKAFEMALYGNAEPQSPSDWFEQGLSLQYLGDKVGAIAAYQTAADLYQARGQNWRRQQVQAKMQELKALKP